MPRLLQSFLTTTAEEEAQKHQSVRNVRFTQVRAERKQQKLGPMAHDEVGLTLLHWAAIYNQSPEIEKLLAHNLSHVDVMTDENALLMHATPIYLAVLYRHTNSISQLMRYQPSLHLRPSQMVSSSFLFNKVKEAFVDELLDVVLKQNDPQIMSLMVPFFLRAYIKERSALEEYTTTYTFIGKTFSAGYSRDSKITGATALQRYLTGESVLSLQEIKQTYPAVTQSGLGKICKLVALSQPIAVPEVKSTSGFCSIS